MRTVYYHSLKHITKDHKLGSIDGVLGYESRALALGGADDVVILDPSLKGDFSAICEHYGRCKLSHCGEVVWSSTPDVLSDFAGAYEISVFLHTRELLPYTKDEERLKAVEFFVSKNNSIRWAREHETLTPETLFSNCGLCGKKCGQSSSCLPLPVVVKPDESDSGVGIEQCKTQKEFKRAIANIRDLFGPQAKFQVQESLPEDTTFLNLQFYGRDDTAEFVELTEQIMKGHAHFGNSTVDDKSPFWAAATIFAPLAKTMARKGLRGIFGLDVAAVPNSFGLGEGTIEFYFVECNPRWNGASYPTRIADLRKLNVPNWSATYVNFSAGTSAKDLIKQLRKRGLEYNPQNKVGVVIFNWGPISSGKAGVMLIGSTEEQRALRQELSKAISAL